MIEIVVLVTLVGIGYMLRQQNTDLRHYPGASRLPRTEVDQKPRGKRHVDRVEKRYADHAFQKSELSGQSMPQSDFKHNNMVPFFRGSVKQASADREDSRDSRLEMFTGNFKNTFTKDPTVQMFSPDAARMAPDEIIGTRASTDYMQDFQQDFVSIRQTNALPFEQERIGPGILGKSQQGYQQFDINEIARPKRTEETRSAVNQKETFEGRVVDGRKGSVRGDIGEVKENRYVRFITQSIDNMFRTLGAFGKPSKKDMAFTKGASKRLSDEAIEQGFSVATGANSRHKLPFLEEGARKVPDRDAFPSASRENMNPSSTHKGKGQQEDHGRSGIMVYDYERKVSTINAVYNSGVTSLIKAMVAPLQDVVKRNPKRDAAIIPYRANNELQPQLPSKGPVKDPDDVTRRTIRESMTLDSREGNLGGPLKLTVYDPLDVTKTTVKQLNLEEAELMNIRGPYKLTIYDPADLPRRTIKDDFAHDASLANIKGPARHIAVDPDMPLKTTSKEDFVQDASLTNIRGPQRHVVTDPDMVLKTTSKEDFVQDASLTNIRGPQRHVVTDPDMVLKTTSKEDFVQDASLTNIRGPQRHTATDPDMILKTTSKEDFVQDSSLTNLNGPKRHTVADPDVTAKTSSKEDFALESQGVNLTGARKSRVQDPDSKAKTTIKEEYSHESSLQNLKTSVHRGHTFDPENIARTTLKQQTLEPSDAMNMSSSRKHGVMHDPDDVARVTVKQDSVHDATFAGSVYHPTQSERVLDKDSTVQTTLKDLTSEASKGHVQHAQRSQLNAGYAGTSFDAPPTYREVYTENSREAKAANRGNGDAYAVIEVEAPRTQKEDQKPRTGNAGAQSFTKGTSYESVYNATIDGLKESTVIGRDFGASSSKLPPSIEEMGELTRSDVPNEMREIREMREMRGAALIGSLPVNSTTHTLKNTTNTEEERFKAPPGPFDVDVQRRRDFDRDPSRFRD